MPVGDLTKTRSTKKRFLVTGVVPADEHSGFWQQKVFSQTTRRPSGGGLGWLLRASGRFCQTIWRRLFKSSNDSGTTGLIGTMRDVIDHETDRFALNGLVWEIPFRHLLLVSDANGACDLRKNPGIELDISKYLDGEFKGYIDPSDEFRVRCLIRQEGGSTDQRNVDLHFGPSVFVPRRDEVPVGFLRYYPDAENETEFHEPRFLDGGVAGIFRRQQAVGFGLSDQSQPINLDTGRADLDAEMFATIKGSATAEGGLFVADFPTANRDDKAYLGIFSGADNPASIVDQSWSVGVLRGNAAGRGRLDLCLDRRDSRLWYYIGSGESDAFAIDAIRVDFSDFGPAARGVWLNFDAAGRLIISAMQRRRYSVHIKKNGSRADVYDWENEAYGAPAISLPEAHIDNKGRVVFSRSDAPLGYLKGGMPQRPVSFVGPTRDEKSYELDWLDFSGCVSIDGQGVELAQAYQALGTGKQSFPPSDNDIQNEITVGPLVLVPVEV